MSVLDAYFTETVFATVTSENGSMVVVCNGQLYNNGYFYQPDRSGGLVNLSAMTVFTSTDDHLFEFIFLICGVVLLLVLFFFVAGMFCCRRSYKKLEVANYQAAAAQPERQPETTAWNGAYKQVQTASVAQPPTTNMSRRGSFHSGAQPSMQNNSRRSSFNGMPNNGYNGNNGNVNMSRNGSQRRASFIQEY